MEGVVDTTRDNYDYSFIVRWVNWKKIKETTRRR